MCIEKIVIQTNNLYRESQKRTPSQKLSRKRSGKKLSPSQEPKLNQKNKSMIVNYGATDCL